MKLFFNVTKKLNLESNVTVEILNGGNVANATSVIGTR